MSGLFGSARAGQTARFSDTSLPTFSFPEDSARLELDFSLTANFDGRIFSISRSRFAINESYNSDTNFDVNRNFYQQAYNISNTYFAVLTVLFLSRYFMFLFRIIILAFTGTYLAIQHFAASMFNKNLYSVLIYGLQCLVITIRKGIWPVKIYHPAIQAGFLEELRIPLT